MEGAWKRLGKEEGRGELEGETEQWRSQALRGARFRLHVRPARLRPAAARCTACGRWVTVSAQGARVQVGGSPVGICKLLFFFFFPLSLRLCADSHVGELIKSHVLPHRSWRTTQGDQQGAPQPHLWILGPSEDLGLLAEGFPETCEHFAAVSF